MAHKYGSCTAHIYRTVIDEIVQQITRGTTPYENAWRNAEGSPWNGFSRREYSGLNMLALWAASMNRGFDCHRWLTERQAASFGGSLRPGEPATMIFFGRRQHKSEGQSRGIYRQYLVYNWMQFDGLPPLRVQPPEPSRSALSRFQALVIATGATVHCGGHRAFFQSDEDTIQLPDRQAFHFPANDIPRVLAHELGHWCLHPSRMNLQVAGDHALMRRAYEEILVELVAAFICGLFDIQPSVRSSDYIAGWLCGTKEKYGHQPSAAEAISRVAHQAMRTTDYLLSFDPGP